MSTVTLPPQTYFNEVTFNDRVTMRQNASGREALRLIGANLVGQILQVFDYLTQPIQTVNTTGGDAIYADHRSVYPPSDVINPVFQILGAAADNLASLAGGFKAGHGAGLGAIYFGTGAPGSAHPVTSGIPANGTLYVRWDGGTGTTIYQVRIGAWTGIL